MWGNGYKIWLVTNNFPQNFEKSSCQDQAGLLSSGRGVTEDSKTASNSRRFEVKPQLSIFVFISAFVLNVSNPAFSQDPNGSDTLFIDCTPPDYSAAESMKVSFDLRLRTDNSGPGADITRMTVPLLITVTNNLKAQARIDSSASRVFSGTAVAGWNTKRVIISSYGGSPDVFPLDLNLGAVKFTSPGLLGPATYTLAHLKFVVKDTCTICIETELGEIPLCLASSGGTCYSPVFSNGCCRVTSGQGKCLAMAGDCNEDGQVKVDDLIFLTNVFFKGVQAPIPACRADFNGDTWITFMDLMYAVNYFYKSGPLPKKTGVCCL